MTTREVLAVDRQTLTAKYGRALRAWRKASGLVANQRILVERHRESLQQLSNNQDAAERLASDALAALNKCLVEPFAAEDVCPEDA